MALITIREEPVADLLEYAEISIAFLVDRVAIPSPDRAGTDGILLVEAVQDPPYIKDYWTRGRGCGMLKVETQNINIAACRFYESRGFELGAIRRFAYPDLPSEIQMLWYKSIGEES